MTIKEFYACVDVFSDRVYAYALKLLRDTALAEDLVQDVFERLWLKRENVEFEKAKSSLDQSKTHLEKLNGDEILFKRLA